MLILSILLEAKLISLILYGTLGLGWIIYLKLTSPKMSQPLYKHEKDFIKKLKTTPGRDFKEWLSLIETSGLSEKKAIRDWLQQQHQLDYLPAHKLSSLFIEDQELHGPKVWFSGSGRGGDMGYESKEGSLKTYWEMGGHDVLVTIWAPDAGNWEAHTNLPLAKREAVLNFIGRKTVERQTTGGKGTYEVDGNFILIKP